MAASDRPPLPREKVLDAVGTLVRYAAGVARLEGLLPEEVPEVEQHVARALVDSMGRDREERLVELAAQLDLTLARAVHQARVGKVALHV